MRHKTRLTITLSPDLVERIDGVIDRKTMRSRSHAIETLLRQVLAPRVDTAVLLAGGKHDGVGLPSLAPIGGVPLIAHTIRHLVGHGIRRVLVLAGRHEREIREFLGDGQRFGARVEYVPEGRARGTAAALLSVIPHYGRAPLLILNGDVLTNIDLGAFVDFHVHERALATIAVKPRQAERRFGRVQLSGNRIVDFTPRSRDESISIVNTGVYLFEPGVLDLIEEGNAVKLETDVFPHLAELGELAAFFFQGVWFEISTPESLRQAEQRWRKDGIHTPAE